MMANVVLVFVVEVAVVVFAVDGISVVQTTVAVSIELIAWDAFGADAWPAI